MWVPGLPQWCTHGTEKKRTAKGYEDSTDIGTLVNHNEQPGSLAANTKIITFSIENGKLYTTSK